MTYRGDEFRGHTGDFPETPVTNRRKAIVWVLVALGSLIVGLIGGTVGFAGKREWAWVFPAATFAAYLLAFRRGLLLWNPTLDRTWRRYLWLDGEAIGEEEEISCVAGENAAKTRMVPGLETSRPPRHELKIVR